MSRPRALIVLLGALVLAGLAAIDAARNVMTELNPALAARMYGSEGAQVDLLSLSLGQPARMPPKNQVFATARARLRDEPLDPGALNVMAYASDPTGRSGAGTRYAELATQVSKRMTFSQLAMTAVSLQRGDVPGSIDRFDAVLRARPEATSLFFPYLKKALVKSDIRAAIADLAAQDSPWVMDFLTFASNDASSTGHAADVMLRAGTKIPPDDRAIFAGPMITRAFQNGYYSAARSLLPLIPGGSASLFESAAITAHSLDPAYGLASWQLSSTSTGSASAASGKGTKVDAFSIYASGGAHDVLASKFLLLPAGNYRLSQQASSTAPQADASAIWRVSCADGGEIWHSGPLVLNSKQDIAGTFAIPPGCRGQRLDLVVNVPFGQPSVDLTIRSIKIDRNRGNGAQ
jgi:hypothetical protein